MALPLLLLTKADLAQWWPISANLDDARVQPWIRRAQDSRLQTILGASLYFALWNAIIVAGDRFDKLLNGDTYKYDTNFDQQFPGVKELLAAYSYAFIVDNNATHVTRGGVNKKAAGDLSENVAAQTSSIKSQDAYSEAIRLEGEFFKWIGQVQDDYPEYNSNGAPQASSQMFWNASRARHGGGVMRMGLTDWTNRHQE